jgi:hypothetical protein
MKRFAHCYTFLKYGKHHYSLALTVKSVFYGEVNKFKNLLQKFDSFVFPDVLLTVLL